MACSAPSPWANERRFWIAIYSTIAFAWANHLSNGFAVLSKGIHTRDFYNYCDYNAGNGSLNRPCTRNGWVNRRYGCTITGSFESTLSSNRRVRKIQNRFSGYFYDNQVYFTVQWLIVVTSQQRFAKNIGPPMWSFLQEVTFMSWKLPFSHPEIKHRFTNRM